MNFDDDDDTQFLSAKLAYKTLPFNKMDLSKFKALKKLNLNFSQFRIDLHCSYRENTPARLFFSHTCKYVNDTLEIFYGLINILRRLSIKYNRHEAEVQR